jgi:hypothetical protein
MEEEEDRVVARDEEDSFPCLFHEKKSPLGTGGEAPKARRRMGGEWEERGGEKLLGMGGGREIFSQKVSDTRIDRQE